MTKLFISYSRKDETFAKRLYADLIDAGFDVWWDQQTLDNRGTTFLHEIQKAIYDADRLILVVSPDALGSQYVEYEWRHALVSCTAINPVLLHGEYSYQNDLSN